MSFYRFASTDKFINTVVTYPSIEFVIYNGTAYYNQQVTLSGTWAPAVKHVPAGHLSLYEYNIDRHSGAFGSIPKSSTDGGSGPAYGSAQYVSSSGLIYPWTVKDSTRIAFRTVTNQTYNSDFVAGDVISGSYPMSASISKELYLAATPRHATEILDTDPTTSWPDDIVTSASVTHLYALKNVMGDYRYLNPHFSVSSSHQEFDRDLTASSGVDDGRGAIDVGLLSIPSIFYGSQIKKGSVKLQLYVTGVLQGELRDTYKNGVLIQSSGAIAANDGQIAGTVMYNEGFIILTGSWSISDHVEEYVEGVGDSTPKWTYFAQSLATSGVPASSGGPATATSSSFALYLSGTNKTQTITLLADAKKSELNHSNNPSYLLSGSFPGSASGSGGSYKELNIKSIKNIVSSSYNDPTGSFKKTTYISKIGIYDKNKDLIAIAKVATPVKKTENRDFTFKLKLDI